LHKNKLCVWPHTRGKEDGRWKKGEKDTARVEMLKMPGACSFQQGFDLVFCLLSSFSRSFSAFQHFSFSAFSLYDPLFGSDLAADLRDVPFAAWIRGLR
jgi:hypothetical protein